MKKSILPIFCCLCLLLCGCSGGGTLKDNASAESGYAEKYLEYTETEKMNFSLSAEQKELSLGDKIGDFKLSKLVSRLDGEELSVRATFECDIEITGRFTYRENSLYGSLIRFYPSDLSAFPVPSGAVTGDGWLVVRKSENSDIPAALSGDEAAEITATVRLIAYSVHTSPHNTVRYIEIKTAVD